MSTLLKSAYKLFYNYDVPATDVTQCYAFENFMRLLQYRLNIEI